MMYGTPIDQSINGRTKLMVDHISRAADRSKRLPTDLSTKTHRTHIFMNKTTKRLLRPLISRPDNMVPPVDLKNLVGSTVHF